MTDQSVPYSAIMVVNNSGEEIPGRAVVVPDGTIDASGRIGVIQADADNLTHVLFNDASPIPDGELGQAWSPYPWAIAGTDDADLPLDAGAEMGTASGEWYLRAGKSGFRSMIPPYYGQTVVAPAPLGVSGGDGEVWAQIITPLPAADPGPYIANRVFLNTSGAWQQSSPLEQYTTVYRARNVGTPDLIPYLQIVRLIPSPTKTGAWECYEAGVEGCLAIITAATAGAAPFSWRKFDAGTNAAFGSTYGTAYPFPINPAGGGIAVPAVTVGTVVWMSLEPSSGRYVFQINQGANWDATAGLSVPGFVVTSDQLWRGRKTMKLLSVSVDGTGEETGVAEFDVSYSGGDVARIKAGSGGGGNAIADFFGGNSQTGGGVTCGLPVYATYDLVVVDGVAQVFHARASSASGVGIQSCGVSGTYTGALADGINILSQTDGIFTVIASPSLVEIFGTDLGPFSPPPASFYFYGGGVRTELDLTADRDVIAAVDVKAGTKFWAAATAGISFTYNDYDAAGNLQTLVWTGGILTSETYTAAPSPTILGEIIGAGAVDGGTW